MAKQERTRKSAPQNKVKSFSAAFASVKPVIELLPAELVRFEHIIASRERETWVPADVATACHLAQIDIERDTVRDMYLEEGRIVVKNGNKVINPLFTIYDKLCTQSKEIRRLLGLSASQRAVSGNKQAKRNQQDAGAAEKVSSLSSLIARPDGQTK